MHPQLLLAAIVAWIHSCCDAKRAVEQVSFELLSPQPAKQIAASDRAKTQEPILNITPSPLEADVYLADTRGIKRDVGPRASPPSCRHVSA
jgi:hypothetical protein